MSIGIDIIGRIKHEREIVATLKIISCKVSDIEFPVPVLPQPATETEMFKYLDFKLLTFSNLVFIQLTGAGRQTDWPNFGVSCETDWFLQLEQTNIIVQVGSMVIMRMYSDLKSHISVIKPPPPSDKTSLTARLKLSASSPRIQS